MKNLKPTVKSSDGSVISAYDYTVNAIGQRERIDRTGSAFSYSIAPHGSVPGDPVQWEYDAFGNEIASKTTGAKANDFAHRFSTKPLDSETGFYYYGYCYCNPVTGRWPGRDPIEEQGGLNLYGMVGNNPTNRIDILGLKNCRFKENKRGRFLRKDDNVNTTPWVRVTDLGTPTFGDNGYGVNITIYTRTVTTKSQNIFEKIKVEECCDKEKIECCEESSWFFSLGGDWYEFETVIGEEKGRLFTYIDQEVITRTSFNDDMLDGRNPNND